MARIDVANVVNSFTSEFLSSKPNASVQDIQVALKNHLQEQKKNGVKISPKEMVAAQQAVPAAYFDIKNYVPSPSVQETATVLQQKQAAKAYKDYTAADAGKYYDELMNRSKEARHNAHERALKDAKAAFSDEKFAETGELNPSNSAVKSENESYVSRKEQKAQKKRAEQASKAEHDLLRDTKTTRDAHYLTGQGQMTKKGKKAYEMVKRSNLSGMSAERIDKMITSNLSGKSAEESAKVFMEGTAQVAEETAKVAKKAKGPLGWLLAGVATVAAAATVLSGGENVNQAA